MYTGIISTNKAVNNAKNRLNQEDKQLTTIYQELLLCFTCNNTLLLDNALLFELNIGKEHLLKSFNILLKNDSLLDISDRKALYHTLFTLIINICEQSTSHMLPMLIDPMYVLVTSVPEVSHSATHPATSLSSSSDVKVNNTIPNNTDTTNTTDTTTIVQADNVVSNNNDDTPTTPVPVAVTESLNSSSIFSLVSRLTSSHSKPSKTTSATTSNTTSTSNSSDKITLLTCLDSLRELDIQVRTLSHTLLIYTLLT